MITLGVWNVRGLCSLSRREEINSLIMKEETPLFCLLKTKAFPSNIQNYMKDLCDSWNFHTNLNHCNKARIWIIWNPEIVNVNIIEDSHQLICSEAEFLITSHKFQFSAIYALNKGTERSVLWETITSLASRINLPWILLGDFNTTRFHDERVGGADPIAQDMEDLNLYIDACSLSDLRATGQNLSWHNNSKTGNLKLRRLDRALVNEE
ncbi:uncharacterized protein LOC143857047 [Tasmannia lanceolata]|uniref:uncharacterized protein LOC143857047 n=1 Tax=Tasmannia lanceolata TaxID=3420 RepID=UPI004063EC3D